MAEFWRMGATPVPAVQIGRLAQEFEAGGWDGLAVGEAHGLLPDPYVVLGVAAAATTTLQVGTSVAVPLRHPLLAADAMATVHALSGGRARFVIGRGDGAMKVLQRKPMPLVLFEDYLRRLQGFLGREQVEIDGAVSSMSRLDDIDPSLDVPKPRVSVAATGPRMIEVAARWADGIDFSVGADLERLRRSIALALEACAAAGRDPESLSLGCYLQVAVVDGDEVADARAREAVRGLIVTHARFSGFEPAPSQDVRDDDHGRARQAVEVMEAVLTSVRGGVDRTAGGAPGELDFYPRGALDDDYLDQFGVIGTAEQCAERLREVLALGLERIYIGTRSVGVDLEETNTHRIGRELLPLLREST
jgi:5,10-methylenetetrahydromethanopterin reductase